ncbi:MAG: hypothetical protein ACE5GE_01680, partial [Phycisphaerae bacterium]
MGQTVDLAVRSPYRLGDTARDVMYLAPPDNSGMTIGDAVLAVRDGVVLGGGHVVTLAVGEAVCQLHWLELALPDSGTAWVIPTNRVDRLSAALPPTVATKSGHDADASDRIADSRPWRTTIQEVVAGPSGTRLTLTDSKDGPAGVGDRLDIYRGPDYVGFAKITGADSGHVQAEQLEAMSPSQATAGDVVVRRRPEPSSRPSPGYIFRLEASHALISLGEADGVRLGDVLVGRTHTGDRTTWRVEHAYPDHCGAKTTSTPKGASGRITQWSPVWRGEPGPSLVGISPESWHATGMEGFFWVRGQAQARKLQARDFVARSKGPT